VSSHRSLSVQVGDAQGRSWHDVYVVVGGQASNHLSIAVAPPSIAVVNLYDITKLSSPLSDPCALLVARGAAVDVVQLDGDNFGVFSLAFSVQLWLGSQTLTCDVCFLSHRTARCGVSASRVATHNLTVTVNEQVSNLLTYSYITILRPPVFVSLSPASGPTAVRET
jgi:hypothetical protein